MAGCGQMGRPMAESLLRGGFDVMGFDVRPPSQFDDFSHYLLADPAGIGDSDVLISVVRDADETLALCFDQQAVFDRKPYPPVLLICSTLSPRFVLELAHRLPADVTLVDAPMSGAPHSAREGKLTFMLGGPEAVLDDLDPLFRAMGARLFHGGGIGAGMKLKVLNNYVAASSVAAVRRVYAMAESLDVEVDALRDVMKASSGATWYGDHFDEIPWSHEGYDPSNTIGILEKDVLAALDMVTDQPGGPERELDRAVLATLKSLKPYSG